MDAKSEALKSKISPLEKVSRAAFGLIPGIKTTERMREALKRKKQMDVDDAIRRKEQKKDITKKYTPISY